MKLVNLSATVLILAASVSGQTPLAFEVASIKVSPPLTPESMNSGQSRLGTRVDAARADFGNASLMTLITYAYRVRDFQVAGPDWIGVTRFDILAKLPEGSSADQAHEMLQTLLAERFKLTLHHDTKEFSVYALVVGKDGPKLTPKPADYDPKAKNTTNPMTLEALASLVSGSVDKPVIDKTGLQGEYMVSLQDFIRERIQPMLARARAQVAANSGGTPNEAASEPTGSGTIGLLQALGLKLESRKLPLPLLVIDHLEKMPTENQ